MPVVTSTFVASIDSPTTARFIDTDSRTHVAPESLVYAFAVL